MSDRLTLNWTFTAVRHATMSEEGRAMLVIGSIRPLALVLSDLQKLLTVERLIENTFAD